MACTGRIWKIHAIGGALFLSVLVSFAWAETVELVTYYPAPAATDGDFNRFHSNKGTIGASYRHHGESFPNGRFAVSGEIGIGTTNPTAMLAIEAAHSRGNPAFIIDSPDSVSLRLSRDRTSDVALVRFATAGVDKWLVGTGQAGNNEDFSFYNNGANLLVIKASTGNVGIGTTNPHPSAKLDVNGPIYQRGGVLHADYVFQPGYVLESIEEHAAFMWESSHLRAVPQIQFDESGQEFVDIAASQRGILEELEKAHIYIEQLNGQIKQLQREMKQQQKGMNELRAKRGRVTF